MAGGKAEACGGSSYIYGLAAPVKYTQPHGVTRSLPPSCSAVAATALVQLFSKPPCGKWYSCGARPCKRERPARSGWHVAARPSCSSRTVRGPAPPDSRLPRAEDRWVRTEVTALRYRSQHKSVSNPASIYECACVRLRRVPTHNEGSSSQGSGESFPAGVALVKSPADRVFSCSACVLMTLSFLRFSIFLALIAFFFSIVLSFLL